MLNDMLIFRAVSVANLVHSLSDIRPDYSMMLMNNHSVA